MSVDLPSSTLPQVMKRSSGAAQKYPSRFFFSIEPGWSLSISRPCRSDAARGERLGTISSRVVGAALDRPGQRIAAQRAEAHQSHLGCSPGSSGIRSSSTMIERALALHHRPPLREVKRHDRDVLLRMYCQMSSSVQFDIGKTRIDLARADARVVDVPQLGALVASGPSRDRRCGTRRRAPSRATSLRRAAPRRR